MTRNPRVASKRRSVPATTPKTRARGTLDELCRPHYASLVRLAMLRLGDREEAEDVVQDADPALSAPRTRSVSENDGSARLASARERSVRY